MANVRTPYQWSANITRSAIYGMLTKILYGRFEWSGLPEDLTSIQLEKFITNWDWLSFAAGYEDDRLGRLILPAWWADYMNVNFLPNHYIICGNEYWKRVPVDDCVAFYDNSSRQSCLPMLKDTCEALIDIWRTMGLNVTQQKNPWIWAGNEDEKHSIEYCLEETDKYKGYILVTHELGDLMKGGSALYKTQPNFIASELMEHYTQVFNRFLTFLGIDNVPIMKRERVNIEETHSNDNLIMLNREDALRMREKACEEYNKKYNANLSVKWKGGFESGGPSVLPILGHQQPDNLPAGG